MAGSGWSLGSDHAVGRIAVLSPHLDDAAISLGAYIRRHTRRGVRVVTVTVMANDPEDAGVEPGSWDRRCGFSSAGDAARVRREEDLRASALLGATPVWLPFHDETYGRSVEDGEVWADLAIAIGEADAVLVPGFPLSQPDHRRVTRLLLERRAELGGAIGLYAEQPYAAGRVLDGRRGGGDEAGLGGLWQAARYCTRLVLRPPDLPPVVVVGQTELSGLDWRPLHSSRRDRRAKRQAVMSYRSQLRPLGARPMLGAWLYELVRGGETVAWLGSTP